MTKTGSAPCGSTGDVCRSCGEMKSRLIRTVPLTDAVYEDWKCAACGGIETRAVKASAR